MADVPLVSFVVPTYNRSALVRQAVESVLEPRASFVHGVEVIVVDDGSEDNTWSELQRFADHSIVRLIRFPHNRGLAAARNAAFAVAVGEWVALLDSDNRLLPDAAREIDVVLPRVPREIGVVWAGSVDKTGRLTLEHQREGRVGGADILNQSVRGEHFSLVRRSLAQANPYPALARRHACEPAFWATLALSTDFWIHRGAWQVYRTDARDRFSSVETRLKSARDLSACYQETARRVTGHAPRYEWELRGKSAFYTAVAGEWRIALLRAMSLLFGLRHCPRNLAVLLACLGGPRLCRRLLRLYGARR